MEGCPYVTLYGGWCNHTLSLGRLRWSKRRLCSPVRWALGSRSASSSAQLHLLRLNWFIERSFHQSVTETKVMIKQKALNFEFVPSANMEGGCFMRGLLFWPLASAISSDAVALRQLKEGRRSVLLLFGRNAAAASCGRKRKVGKPPDAMLTSHEIDRRRRTLGRRRRLASANRRLDAFLRPPH